MKRVSPRGMKTEVSNILKRKDVKYTKTECGLLISRAILTALSKHANVTVLMTWCGRVLNSENSKSREVRPTIEYRLHSSASTDNGHLSPDRCLF